MRILFKTKERDGQAKYIRYFFSNFSCCYDCPDLMITHEFPRVKQKENE